MDLRIAARHFDLTPEVQEYAEKRILPLSRYYDKIIDAQLILTAERHRQKAELSISITGRKFVVKSETNNLFASIDEVSHKMERLLRDHHEKVRNRKHPEYEQEKRQFLQRIPREE